MRERLTPPAELNVFQVEGNAEADRQTPMFGRDRIGHLGLQMHPNELFAVLGRGDLFLVPA